MTPTAARAVARDARDTLNRAWVRSANDSAGVVRRRTWRTPRTRWWARRGRSFAARTARWRCGWRAGRADRIVVDDDLRREKDRVKTTLALTLHAAGRDLLEYELHAVMRLLLADPRRARAWLSGQVSEQPCRVLAVSRAAHAEIHRLADEA